MVAESEYGPLNEIRERNQRLWQEISIKQTLDLQEFKDLERDGRAKSAGGMAGLQDLILSSAENSQDYIEEFSSHKMKRSESNSDSDMNSSTIKITDCRVEPIKIDEPVIKSEPNIMVSNSIAKANHSDEEEYTTQENPDRISDDSQESIIIKDVHSNLIRKLFPVAQKPVKADDSTGNASELLEKLSQLQLENTALKTTLSKCKKERDASNFKSAKLQQEQVQLCNLGTKDGSH